jgi:nitroimidazol reductase NimA-like FMN-containing flavoprotein (pyridoxamine 5'-phosphate oxidase superfamily)
MSTETEDDPAAVARAIIESSRYLTLGTADADGVPWVSPVWYAPAGDREFFWASRPDAQHSRNIATRPQVSLVIFDSHAPIGTGRGVYVSGMAEELSGDELDRGIAVFSRRSEEQGAAAWTRDDVQPPAEHRLYRATASEHFVLGSRDERIRVRL